MPNDAAALDRIRSIMDKIGDYDKAGFNRAPALAPIKNPIDLFEIVTADRSKQFDMHEVILRLVDNSEFDEYKEDYGKTILCGYARIEGWSSSNSN